jgi:hypothetical protein
MDTARAAAQFRSLLSRAGIPIEDIAHLGGHANTTPAREPRHMIGQARAWVDLSGRRLIWSGGVWQSGGVHYFTDEFFEDIFEGDHSLGPAVVVDEAGQVRAAAT